ncbi:MAG: hypothetical protein HQK77_12975 [Desulfobacterales bacterium]|nr:hypothetical protein [Desulfobacterales bacterium]
MQQKRVNSKIISVIAFCIFAFSISNVTAWQVDEGSQSTSTGVTTGNIFAATGVQPPVDPTGTVGVSAQITITGLGSGQVNEMLGGDQLVSPTIKIKASEKVEVFVGVVLGQYSFYFVEDPGIPEPWFTEPKSQMVSDIEFSIFSVPANVLGSLIPSMPIIPFGVFVKAVHEGKVIAEEGVSVYVGDMFLPPPARPPWDMNNVPNNNPDPHANAECDFNGDGVVDENESASCSHMNNPQDVDPCDCNVDGVTSKEEAQNCEMCDYDEDGVVTWEEASSCIPCPPYESM